MLSDISSSYYIESLSACMQTAKAASQHIEEMLLTQMSITIFRRAHHPSPFLSKPRHPSRSLSPPHLIYIWLFQNENDFCSVPPSVHRMAGCAHRSLGSGVAPLQIEKLKWWFSPAFPSPLFVPFFCCGLSPSSPEFCARSLTPGGQM